LLLGRQLNAWTFGRTDPDKEMVSKAKAGDRRAFDHLVKSHGEMLRGFVVMRVGQEAADDVLQEIWTACWTGLANFGSRSGFKAWLYGIASNKCKDYYRNRGRSGEQSLDDLDDVADEDNAYSKVELREAVKGALNQLSSAQKEVVELYYYAGLTLPEIAQNVKRNLNTVKYQFYRAHEQVAQTLGEQRA
jgi:RNA polymerase sigma-70 factor (ECF subfamily)